VARIETITYSVQSANSNRRRLVWGNTRFGLKRRTTTQARAMLFCVCPALLLPVWRLRFSHVATDSKPPQNECKY